MNQPSWFPDESALAGAEHADPAYAGGFDRKTGGGFEDDLRHLVELGLGEDSTLVDLGAGTGALALLATASAGRVVAVDPSPAMLDVLRDRARSVQADRLQIVNAGFLSYEHEGAPADFVFSRNALHHLPDAWKAVALGRVKAVLRPGGIFWLRDLVYGFEPGEIESTFEKWLATAPLDPADGWTREELEHHVRTEHSTFSWLLEPMLEHAGFEILEKDFTSSRIYGSYVCRA
jgi:SAM-dependent methyltransferase